MTLGRILGFGALPPALFAVAVGVVLVLGGCFRDGYGFAVSGVVLAGLAVWMIVTGRPELTGSMPWSRRRGPDTSRLPDSR